MTTKTSPWDDQAALRLAAREEAGLCTIVRIDGSYSRRIGAQLAVTSDGRMAGSLSDGCLESELSAQLTEARAAGERRLLRFGAGSPFIDFRLPCGSGLDILVEPRPDRAALRAVVAQLDRRDAAMLDIGIGEGSAAGLLTQRQYIPAMRLLLLGSGPEVDHLALLASSSGLIVERRSPDHGLTLARAPTDLPVDAWTAIALLFHDHEWEGALLDWALHSHAFFIGAQGGAKARERRIDDLRARGHGEDALQRVISPIGLIGHAREPDVLALSILSQIVGAYHHLHPHP